MTTSTGDRAESLTPTRKRRSFGQLAISVTLVSLVAVLEGMLVTTYQQSERSTNGFGLASDATTLLANVQREGLVLESMVSGLLQDPSLEPVRVQRAILARQLSVASSHTDESLGTKLAPAQGHLSRFDRRFAKLGATANHAELMAAVPGLAEPIAAANATIKTLYDREDIFYGKLALDALHDRAFNQLMLLLLGVAVAVLGGSLVFAMRRRANQESERAELAILRELTERRAAEREIVARERRFGSMIEHSSDIVTLIDPSGKVTYQSPSIERILGLDPHGATLGAPFVDLVHADDRDAAVRFLHGAVTPGSTRTTELRLRRVDGTARHCEMVCTNLTEDADVGALVLNIRDVTERKTLEDHLEFRATHDPLTGLPSRLLFKDRLQVAIANLGRSRDGIGVLFLDIDDFKRVNDSLGHAAGDDLLCALADRLQASVRAGDTVARFGGDEFAVLLSPSDEAYAVSVGQRILESLDVAFLVGTRELFVHVSIGVSIGTGKAEAAEDLMRDADAAMYAAKEDGKGRVRLFDPEMQRAALTRVDLESQLCTALERDEFVAFLQPIVDIRTGHTAGFEALARWRRSNGDLVGPADFITVAEECGAIVPIGLRILELAAAMTVAQRERARNDPRIPIHVNLSARQLSEPGLVLAVKDVLRRTGLPAHDLVLEVTESILMEAMDSRIAALAQLRALGIRIAIDDFGSGYSSLAYLRRLPIDILKIDKEFVEGIGWNDGNASFMRAIHRLADTIGLVTIVEGVETREQLHVLREIGFQLARGYLFGQPMPGEDISDLRPTFDMGPPEPVPSGAAV